jgi:hypothetical protein
MNNELDIILDYICSLPKEHVLLSYQHECSKPIDKKNHKLISMLYEFMIHYNSLKKIEYIPSIINLIHTTVYPFKLPDKLFQVYLYINITNFISGSKIIPDYNCNSYYDINIKIKFKKLFEIIIRKQRFIQLYGRSYTYESNHIPHSLKVNKRNIINEEHKNIDDIDKHMIQELTQKLKLFENKHNTIHKKLIIVSIDGNEQLTDQIIYMIKEYLSNGLYIEVWTWKSTCHPFYKELGSISDSIWENGIPTEPIMGINPENISHFDLYYFDEIRKDISFVNF